MIYDPAALSRVGISVRGRARGLRARHAWPPWSPNQSPGGGAPSATEGRLLSDMMMPPCLGGLGDSSSEATFPERTATRMDQPTLYPSVVANLFATGLHQVIFRTAGVSARGTIEATAADFADSVGLDALARREKEAGALGTLVGERASLDLLRDVCRHATNPWKLEYFELYQPTTFDLAVVSHGTLDGERAVWDQLVVPHLSGLSLSTDPGVVAPNAMPGHGFSTMDAPIQNDPLLAENATLRDIIVTLGTYKVVLGKKGAADTRISDTDYWRDEVLPHLGSPLMSA